MMQPDEKMVDIHWPDEGRSPYMTVIIDAAAPLVDSAVWRFFWTAGIDEIIAGPASRRPTCGFARNPKP
jgi:hypothetical protein